MWKLLIWIVCFLKGVSSIQDIPERTFPQLSNQWEVEGNVIIANPQIRFEGKGKCTQELQSHYPGSYVIHFRSAIPPQVHLGSKKFLFFQQQEDYWVSNSIYLEQGKYNLTLVSTSELIINNLSLAFREMEISVLSTIVVLILFIFAMVVLEDCRRCRH